MPVSKPASGTLPRWATSATGILRTAEPPSGTKDDALEPGDKVPAQYWNWLHFNAYKWLEWLNDIENQAITWAAAHTFSAVVTFGVRPAQLPAPTHNFIGTSGGLAIGSNWNTTGEGGSPTTGTPYYYKDVDGDARLVGTATIVVGATIQALCTLPVGYRPVTGFEPKIPVVFESSGLLHLAVATVESAGGVVFSDAGTAFSDGDIFYLDSIRFPTT